MHVVVYVRANTYVDIYGAQRSAGGDHGGLITGGGMHVCAEDIVRPKAYPADARAPGLHYPPLGASRPRR